MSLRLKNLEQLLNQQYAPADESLTGRKLSRLAVRQTKHDVDAAYRALGGISRPEKIAFTDYSLQYKKFCVVFDEVQNFNRYRSTTLRSALYEKIPGFPLSQYKVYCRTRETECMKSAKSPPHWTNREAELHFGEAMDPGDLGLNGAPGWKLRAMQALLLDAKAVEHNIRVVHLSVWDELMIGNRLVRLSDLLLKVNGSAEYFLKFFQRKLIQTYGD
jgi:hypothetical protein